jgi:hypothetical protein
MISKEPQQIEELFNHKNFLEYNKPRCESSEFQNQMQNNEVTKVNSQDDNFLYQNSSEQIQLEK